jgi:hypothetical protein
VLSSFGNVLLGECSSELLPGAQLNVLPLGSAFDLLPRGSVFLLFGWRNGNMLLSTELLSGWSGV